MYKYKTIATKHSTESSNYQHGNKSGNFLVNSSSVSRSSTFIHKKGDTQPSPSHREGTATKLPAGDPQEIPSLT